MNLKNKEKLDIIFAGLGNDVKAKDLVSDLIVDIQESFFKLGKQVARMEMERQEMALMENKEMITSRELLEKINEFREKEYQEKAKAGTLTKKENLSGR